MEFTEHLKTQRAIITKSIGRTCGATKTCGILEHDHPWIVDDQHSAKKIPSKQKNKNTTRDSKSSSRDKNHRSSKKNKAPKKPSIELKKINRAVERNKKSRKPAKGLWGLIKSMLPKF